MVLSKLDVTALAQLYVSGNESAFPYLLQKTQTRVFTFIKNKVNDTDVANDLFQDTYFKVVQNIKLGKYTEEGKFMAWTLRIAHNLCMDYFNETAKLPKYDPTFVMDDDDANQYNAFDHLDITEDGYDVQLEHNELVKDIKRYIAMLPTWQREMMVMRFTLNMSFKEIAAQNNITINTALGRMRYTLQHLRQIMKSNGVEFNLV